MTFCGTRGSTPAPGPEFVRYGGETSCVALAHDDQVPRLLLDAGTGLRRVARLLDGAPFRGAIVLSHLHWDHTHGLPFFTAGDHPDGVVDLYLPAQAGDPEEVLARAMSPPHFPIRPAQLRGQWRFHQIDEGTTQLDGFEVVAHEIPHKGGRTLGYRVSDATGTVTYMPDHHPLTHGPGDEGFGAYHPTATALAASTDLLVHDAQYTATEFRERSHFGHSAVDYAVGLADHASATTLALFHHDPPRTDLAMDEVVAAAQRRADTVQVVGATADMVVQLPRR